MKKSRISLALALLMLLSCVMTPMYVGYAADDDPIPAAPTINKTELLMLLGGSLEHLEVLDAPAGSPIVWASDDWRVARVSDGNVISIGEGTANVTAKVGDVTLTCAVSVYTEAKLITNDVVPKDTDGNYIFAQWSTIQKFGDKFYRYGMAIGRSIGLFNSQKQGKGSPSGSGWTIVIYSSDDLVAWKRESTITSAGGFPNYARLGISYNAKNDYYVLTGDTSGARFATSPTPTGPWTNLKVQTGMNQIGPDPAILSASADMTTFYDYKTGKAYLPFVCGTVTNPVGGAQNTWQTLNERDIGYIGVLDEDGTTVVEVHEVYNNLKDTHYNLLREGGREANCMFTYDGWYYYVGSGLRGWNGGPTFYMGGARTPTAKTYTNEVGIPNSMFPMRGTGQSNSHTTQVEGFITVDTPVTAQAPVGQMVLEWGDRFTNDNANGYGFTQFAPLSFLDPATAPPMTAKDLPETPDPQAYSTGEAFNADNPWKDMSTFYPFLPASYPYKNAEGEPEWQRQEWPIPVYNDMTQFYFDVANGSWSPGPNNNYLTNSYFENDRLAGGSAMTIDGVSVNYPVIQTYVNNPTGWDAEHISGQIAQINYGGNRATGATDRNYQLVKGVQTGGTSSTAQLYNGAWAGNYTWYHGYTKRNAGTEPYKTKTYQLAENLPDGIYTVYGWVQSSGGQNECYMYAKSGGVEYKASLNTPIGNDKTVTNTASTNWKLIVVSEEIVVKDGKCEVGFYSDAAADQWAEFDDLALIRTGDLPAAPALNETEMEMLLGGELFQLEVSNVPAGATVTWASDDWRVVRASPNGYITSLDKGKANVTATISGAGIETTVLTCAVTVKTLPLLITNDTFHMDTDGNPIFAQMGSINKYDDGTGKYWWYGVDSPDARGYYDSLKAGKGTIGRGSNPNTTRVNLYSSDNLVDWKFEGAVVTNGQNGWPSPGWFGRLGVVYNKKTGTYHMCGQGNNVFFGSAPTPQGPWKYEGSQNLSSTLGFLSASSGDQTMFYDPTTDKAYVVFSCGGVSVAPSHQSWTRNSSTGIWTTVTTNNLGGATQNFWETLPERDQVYIGVLNDSYTAIAQIVQYYNGKEDTFYNLFREGGREANGMFVYNGWYYAFASGLRGWNTGPATFYMGGSRDPKLGGFVNEVGLPNNMSPMRGSVTNNSHTSQVVGMIVSDVDKITSQAPRGQMVLQMGDRWGNKSGIGGIGYDQFNPISFVDPATLGHPTEDDIPRVPNPKNYPITPPAELFAPGQDLTIPGLQNPAVWATMDTFFPFLPKGYEQAMGSAEWVKPAWDIPVFNNVSQFYWDIANGTWSAGPNNNYLENGQFENDRLAGGRDVILDGQVQTLAVIQQYVSEPNGWKSEHIAGQSSQINWGGGGNGRASGTNVFRYQLGNPETYNTTTGLPTQSWYSAYAGNYTWYHGYSKRNPGTDPYKTKTSQVANDLPDGTYTFYGWIRSSGGQTDAYMYADDKKVSINTAINEWTLIAVEGVDVTGGKLEVGFYSDAAADQWLYIDDVALIKTADAEAVVSVSVSTPQIVETLAAYLNITVENALIGSKAYFVVNDQLLYETPVVDGKARMYIPAAPVAGAYTIAIVNGDGVLADCDIMVVKYNRDIWAPIASVNIQPSAPFTGSIFFADNIALTASSVTTVFGNAATNVSASGSKVDFSFTNADFSANNKIVISGVKYPALFPSYSFTFTVAPTIVE